MFYLGISLYIIFLVLWFVTLPKPEKSFDAMTVGEKLDSVRASESKMLDDSNYLRAVNSNNNVYCDKIVDVKLREKCFKEVTSSEVLVVDDRSEQDILDDSNYLRAVNSNNVVYCDRIFDVDLRYECLVEVQSLSN